MFKRMRLISILVIFVIVNISTMARADDKIDVLNEEKLHECASEIVEEDSPKINSRNAIILDKKTGKVLWEKNGNKRSAMASTTKIMTCIIVLEKTNLDEMVCISAKSAGTGGSRLGLKKEDKITVRDLLYGLMLRSRK